MEKQNLIGQVDADQIARWKEEHKISKVFTYTTENRICYMKPVDRDTYSVAASKVSTSPAKFNEEVVKKIWLGGDEAIRTEDRYYFGLIDHVEALMDKKKGELGEL
jgi:hypothetical protein